MNFKQLTDTILMVRPFVVNSNAETAADNHFQQSTDVSVEELTKRGQQEFDRMVAMLSAKGIHIIVDESMAEVGSVDAHFPNNWISFHQNGHVAVYPMFASNRRLERREEVLEVVEANKYHIDTVVDYSQAEEDEVFLEGTGSMVLDRKNKKAYAAISERTDEDLFIEFCEDFEYLPVSFTANTLVDGKKFPIYHTNVMMSISEKFAVICSASISDKKERKSVLKHLRDSGLEIINITTAQMGQFAGNILTVLGKDEKRFLIMSESARKVFRDEQVTIMEKYASIVVIPIPTIELCGGGSVRCMMAEVFLPREE